MPSCWQAHAVVSLFVACAPFLARAHDAAPVAYDVHAVRGPSGDDLTIETNYGLLRHSPDGTWRLLCDDVRGPGAKWFTAALDGTVGMASLDGYARSTDGCTFAPTPGIQGPPLRLERVPRESANDILLLLTEAAGGGSLLRSDDDGVTFRPLALADDDRPTSLAVDAHRQGHVALLARQVDGALRIHDSTDAGATWVIGPSLPSENPIRLLATGPSGHFLRANIGGRGELLRLDAGGLSTVLSTEEPALFVTEVRAGDVWAASPRELWRSEAGGAASTWTRQTGPGELTCLRNVAGLLYACIEDDGRRVVVSVSSDFGATWRDLLRFSDVAGPVACGDDTDVGAVCNARWPVDALALGAPLREPDPLVPPATGCACDVAPAAFSFLGIVARRRRA